MLIKVVVAAIEMLKARCRGGTWAGSRIALCERGGLMLLACAIQAVLMHELAKASSVFVVSRTAVVSFSPSCPPPGRISSRRTHIWGAGRSEVLALHFINSRRRIDE